MRRAFFILVAIVSVTTALWAIDAFKGGSAVDSAVPVDQWLDTVGDTAGGNFNWGGYNLTNVGTLQVATDAQLPTGSIGTTEIANNAITSTKILDGTISPADIGTILLEDLDDVPAYSGNVSDWYTIRWDNGASDWKYAVLPRYLNDIANVSAGAPDASDLLAYVGGQWSSEAFGDLYDLQDLGNVTVAGAATGNLLRWNGSAWVNSNTLPSHSHTGGDLTLSLDGLSDVSTSGVTTGKTIIYNGASWEDGLPTMTLNNLSNVTAPSPSSNQRLIWNGSAWVPDSLTLSDVTNVSVGGATNGQILTYSNAVWYALAAPEDTPLDLDDLGDVTAPAPSDGQLLSYDTGTGYWVSDSVTLDDLYDVTAPAPNVGQALKWSGAAWTAQDDAIGDALALGDLTNVDTTGAVSNKYLRYNGSNWVPADAPAVSDIWLDTAGDTMTGWLVAGGYGLTYADGTTSRYTFWGSGQANMQGDSAGTYIREQTTGQYDIAGGVRIVSGGLRLYEASTPTVGPDEGLLYVVGGPYEDLYFKDDSQTAVQLTNQGKIRALRSIEGVYNDGGNIDLVEGAGMTITASDAGNTITFASSAVALDDLTDVQTNGVTNGQVLKYDSASGQWVPDDDDASGGGVTNILEQLADVTITGVSDNDFLVYDVGTTNWVNRIIATNDLPAHAVLHAEGGADPLDLSTFEATDLGDVSYGTPGTNDFFRWTGSVWTNATAALDDLSDVELGATAANQILYYTGSSWTNAAMGAAQLVAHASSHEPGGGDAIDSELWELKDLGNVDDTLAPAGGDAGKPLEWDGAKWTLGTDGGLTSVAFNDLTDVTLTSPATNAVVYYDGGGWIDGILPVDGLPAHASTHGEAGSDPLDLSTFEIEDLGNVDTSGVDTNDLLTWNGASWVDVTYTMEAIADVDLGVGVTDEDILAWDSGSSMWTNVAFSAYQVEDLGNVDTSGVSTNDVLSYNGASWVDVDVNTLVTDLWLDVAGDTMAGNIAMGGNDITGGGDATFNTFNIPDNASYYLGLGDDANIFFGTGQDYQLGLSAAGLELLGASGMFHVNGLGGARITTSAGKGIDLDVSAANVTLQAQGSLTTLVATDWTDVQLAAGVIGRTEIGTFNLVQCNDATNLVTATDGQAIAWNDSASRWDPVTLGGSMPDGTTADDIPYWTGAAWDDTAFNHFTLDDLGQVSIGTPTLNYVLKWNGSNWTPQPDNASASMYLNDLLDVTAPSATANYLVYGTGAAWGVKDEWFVDEAGDTMSGNLDLDDNDLLNVDELDVYQINVDDTAGAYLGIGDTGSIFFGAGQDYELTLNGADLRLNGTAGYFYLNGAGQKICTTGGHGITMSVSSSKATFAPISTTSEFDASGFSSFSVAAGSISRAEIGTFNLDDITDVTITAAATNDVLSFNGAAWVDRELDSIDDLDDVAYSPAPTAGEILLYGAGGDWENADPVNQWAIADLSDVDDSIAPTTDQILTYDGAKWVAAAASTVTDLDALSDVTLTNPGSPGPLEVLVNAGGDWYDYTLTGADLPTHASRHSEGGTDELTFSSWEIDDLGDVGWSTKPVSGDPHFLVWEALDAEWDNQTVGIDELDDVTITAAATNQILRWNGAAWINYTLLNTDIPDHGSRHAENGADPISLATFEIADLGDVDDAGGYSDWDILRWDPALGAGAWTAESLELGELSDVSVAGVSASNILYYAGGVWYPGDLPLASLPAHATTHEAGGADEISLGGWDADELADVTYSTAPQDGEVLKWDTDHWEPATDLTTTNQLYLADLENVTGWDDGIDLVIYPGSLAAGDTLKYVSGEWRNQAFAHESTHDEGGSDSGFIATYEIEDLNQVTSSTKPTGASDPHVLIWPADAATWDNGTLALADLSNVASTSPTSGYALIWGGSSWGPAKYAVADLDNVDTSGVLTNDFLRYNGASWVDYTLVAADLPDHASRHENGGADAIDIASWDAEDLGDITYTPSPVNGYVLTWDTDHWKPAAQTGGSGLPSHFEGDVAQYIGGSWVSTNVVEIAGTNHLYFAGSGDLHMSGTGDLIFDGSSTGIEFEGATESVEMRIGGNLFEIVAGADVGTVTLDLSTFGAVTLPYFVDMVEVTPEYPNGVVVESGTGTMDIDVEGPAASDYKFKPYYEWSSSSDDLQQADIYVGISLPNDFIALGDTIDTDTLLVDGTWLEIEVETGLNTSADNRITVYAHVDGYSSGEETIDNAYVTSSATWETWDYTDSDTTLEADAAAGTMLFVHLKLQSKNTSGAYCKVGRIRVYFARCHGEPWSP